MSLSVQWGKHARTTDYEQITFPISFTNVNYTCISTSYDLNSNADVTSAYSGTYNSGKYPEEQERTVSRFYVKTGSNAGGRDWIAIGQQQWGVKTSLTDSWTYYPIPFTSTVYGILGQQTAARVTAHAYFDDVDLIKFHYKVTQYYTYPTFQTEAAGWFLAYGKQQWGVVTDDRSTLTFLLPFSNSDYFYAVFPTNKVNVGGINLHGVRHPTYLELYSSISNNSNTANNWQFSGRNINPCWLAVGIQQWGNKQYSSWQSTRFDYPISMTTVYTALASRQLKGADKTEFGCTILTTGSQFLTFMGYVGTANIVVLGR